MFHISVPRDVTLADLRTLYREGKSVMRSAHVGNQYMSNLVLLHAGIPAIWYDRTTGRRDHNYHPDVRIKGGRKDIAFCAPDVLVARTLAGWNHLSVVRRAIPHAQIELHGDYLRRHATRVDLFQFFRTLQEWMGGKKWRWDRFVHQSGTVETRPVPTWQQVEQEGIFGVTAETHGWTPPNIFNILLFTACELKERGGDTVHHLSGPDMVTYLHSMQDDLHVMWERLAPALGLPADITFCLYPTADLRFATVAARKNQLDELVSAYRAVTDWRREKADIIKAAHGHQSAIEQCVREEARRKEQLGRALRDCPEVLYDIKQGVHITQHDVADKGIYTHPWMQQSSFRQLAEAVKFLRKVNERHVHNAAA